MFSVVAKVESDSTSHMHSQFSKTIKAALKSTNEERAILRARSALQRFPVLEWRSRMENMHRRSIKASRKYAGDFAAGPNAGLDFSCSMKNDPSLGLSSMTSPAEPISASALVSFRENMAAENPYGLAPQGSPQTLDGRPLQSREFLSSSGEKDHEYDALSRPSMSRDSSYKELDRPYAEAGLTSPMTDYFHAVGDGEANEEEIEFNRISVVPSEYAAKVDNEDDQYGSFLTKANKQLNRTLTRKLTHTHGRHATKDPFIASGAPSSEPLSPTTPRGPALRPPLLPFADNRLSTASFDSINSVMEDHGADSPLNKAIEGFTDENGQVTQEFIAKLGELTSGNSKADLCIAEYLVAAEKAHFRHVRDDKLALARSYHDSAPPTPRAASTRPFSRAISVASNYNSKSDPTIDQYSDGSDRALNSTPELSRWQIRLQHVYYGWPLYAILLALGQVLGATSFQLSLLGGTSSQRTFDLYSSSFFLSRHLVTDR